MYSNHVPYGDQKRDCPFATRKADLLAGTSCGCSLKLPQPLGQSCSKTLPFPILASSTPDSIAQIRLIPLPRDTCVISGINPTGHRPYCPRETWTSPLKEPSLRSDLSPSGLASPRFLHPMFGTLADEHHGRERSLVY